MFAVFVATYSDDFLKDERVRVAMESDKDFKDVRTAVCWRHVWWRRLFL